MAGGLAGLTLFVAFILASVAAASTVLVGALILELLVIEPMAFVLERKSIDKLIKIGALLLLMTGFTFDLLAS